MLIDHCDADESTSTCPDAFANICHWTSEEVADSWSSFCRSQPGNYLEGDFSLVRLRNLQPFAMRGLEIAYRFEHGVAETCLEEWLLTLPDRGARLTALADLLSDPVLFDTVTDDEDAQALRIAVEVINTVATICRDPEPDVAEIVAGLMGETAMEKDTVLESG